MNDNSIFNNNLTLTSILGDTLCKFTDFERSTVDRVMQSRGMGVLVPPSIYRINGQIMLKKGHNDTVFRVSLPNRLTPTYVLNWGNYKPDIIAHVAGSALEGKLVFGSMIETPRFIFIYYTEGRDFPNNRDRGNVKDYWAIYNKTARTLTHHVTSDARALIENDIEPVGMPFWPEGINHRGEMYMVFYKETIKCYIERDIKRNVKLQTIYDSMNDGEVCIMVVN